MKNIIIITSDINENYNFASAIVNAKKLIAEHFGNKYTEYDYVTPSITVKTEVSKADIDHIHGLINDDSIHFLILLTNENNDVKMEGEFIDLRDE